MATDAIISMVINRLAPMIEKKVRDEVSLLLNADKEVKTLSSKLQKIHQVLADAERKAITDPEVKFWLDELQEIAYEIDFALDEWEYEHIRRKFEEEAKDSNAGADDDFRDKVTAFLRAVCSCFKQTVRRRGIALDVRQINDRLDNLAQRSKDEFKFVPNLSGRDTTVPRPCNSTTSFVNEAEVRGRDPEKDILVPKLLSENDDLQIVSIVGTGGMGKTTLAQIVFNDVKDRFNKAGWVYVSDPFDQIKVAKSILEELTKQTPDASSRLQALLDRIKESVRGKRFILVLDDVWTEDYKTWEPFKIALQSSSAGSRILVTTRKSIVAEQVMESAYAHELGRLSDSDCCSVLEQRALPGGSSSSDRRHGIAMEIAKKCNGMPLAAIIIGGVLRFKMSPKEWERVLESEWWGKMREGVFPFLELSYQELYPAMKRCFSFCAVFQKGERIEVDSLVRIWMAQGFLASSGKVTMEEKGRDYFKDLEARSLFQDVERDEIDRDPVVAFRMHDVVRGFAQSLTKNEFLVADDDDGGGVSRRNIRHLNLQGNIDNDAASTILSSVSKEKLHSLLFDHYYPIPSDIFSQLKRVKWLCLYRCYLTDIPEEIGRLIHLRLLDLGYNYIKKLPETISDLYNLQTLDISVCSKLDGLPQKMERLTNLSHLLNRGMNFEFPRGFEKLTGLQTLVIYSCNKLGYLKDMNKLSGSLTISVTELSDVEAERADLKSKRLLRELALDLGENVRYEEIESLRPHQNLQVLRVKAQKIPSWVTEYKFSSLRKLTLYIFYSGEDRPLSLPCLGQLPSLEYLSMVVMNGMKRIGNEFLGIDFLTESFPKLKSLEFLNCESWEEWDDINGDHEINNSIDIFPCLEVLIIFGCSELKALPHRLLRKASSLKHLTINACPYLTDRYQNKKIDGEWDLLAHIPMVTFQ